ncbi:sigma-70 family RNA polymerase sigma factor [Sorangium sp. So ce315]|uniref:RNA polymerase sigma factor n=1 Tax=Sorangium sp. So ce315 TaxID=3133299 RepID=UPI003F63E0C9
MSVALLFCVATAWALLWLFWIQRARAPALASAGVMLSSGLEGEGPPQGSGGATLSPTALAVRAYVARPTVRHAVRRWLVRLGIPRQHVDDLVQDVIAGALEGAHRYDPAFGPIERWLNGITVHVACHAHEKAQRRREALDANAAPPGVEEGADVALEREEARAAVRAALLRMPLELSVMVRQHDIEERPMVEIAEEQGIPTSTAYKWRMRGLAELGDLLRAWARAR